MDSAVSPRVRFENAGKWRALPREASSVSSPRKLSFPSSNQCTYILYAVICFHVYLPLRGNVTHPLEQHCLGSNPGSATYWLWPWIIHSLAQWEQQCLPRGVVTSREAEVCQTLSKGWLLCLVEWAHAIHTCHQAPALRGDTWMGLRWCLDRTLAFLMSSEWCRWMGAQTRNTGISCLIVGEN